MSADVTLGGVRRADHPQTTVVIWLVRAMAFAVPLLAGLDMPVVGHLLASDIAMVICIPFVFGASMKKKLPGVIVCGVICAAIWFIVQFISDYVNQSSPDDYLRVWAKILLTAAYLVFFWKIYNFDRATIVWSMYGLGILFIISSAELGENYSLIARFGGALGISSIVIAFLSGGGPERIGRFAWRAWAVVLPFIVALGSLAIGARSAAIPLLACGFFGLANGLVPGSRGPSLRVRLGIVLALCVGMYGTFYAYNLVSAAGLLGAETQTRTLTQGNYQNLSPLRVLIGARPESLVAAQAIIDKPLLGHGSWAKDPYYVALIHQYSQFFTYGQDIQSLQAGGYLIPTHSYITGAMVDGGIFAGLFWAYIILIIVRRLLFFKWPLGYYPIILYCGVELIYCILFSPYGQSARVSAAIWFGAVVVLTEAPKFQKQALPLAASGPLKSP